jgi:hypothetical protein
VCRDGLVLRVVRARMALVAAEQREAPRGHAWAGPGTAVVRSSR